MIQDPQRPLTSRHMAGYWACDRVLIAAAVYLLLILAGTWMLALPEVSGRAVALPTDRAFFMAVNAATLCGFPTSIPPEDLSAAGQLLLFGLMLGGTFLTLWIGGMTLRRICNLYSSDAAMAGGSAVMTAAAILAGWAFFPHENPAAAMMLGLSALGNCGLTLQNPPAIADWRLHAVVLPLAVAGGMGVALWIELLQLPQGRPLSRHGRTALLMSAGVYLFFLLAFALVRWLTTDPSPAWRSLLPTASADAINSRSAGFAIQTVYSLPRALQWLLIAAMAVGSTPGGTGGGLKITLFSELARSRHAAKTGKAVNISLYWALSWGAIYLILCGIALLALLAVQPQTPADRLLFDVVSAIGNAGLTFNPISQYGSSLYILSALMLAGRFIPFFLIWRQSRSTIQPDVAIG